MTDKTNDGGPAFPGSYAGQNGLPVWSEGMTLRDYFAAKIACGDFASQSPVMGVFTNGEKQGVLIDRAALYYSMADAMLKARGGQ